MNQEHLHQQISDLKKHWDTINGKLNKLRDEKIHETRTEEKFRLEHLITETESERQEIEQRKYSVNHVQFYLDIKSVL